MQPNSFLSGMELKSKSVSYYLIVARQQIHIHQQHVQYPSLKIIFKNQSTFNSAQKNCCIILSWRVTLTVHLEQLGDKLRSITLIFACLRQQTLAL